MTVSSSVLNNASFENYPDLIYHLYYIILHGTQLDLPVFLYRCREKPQTMYIPSQCQGSRSEQIQSP